MQHNDDVHFLWVGLERIHMAREKKNGTYLNVRIDSAIYDAFAAYCEEVGQTKTVAIERILSRFLDEYREDPAAAVLQQRMKTDNL